MTDILQKFNTNELMSIDLNTLTYQQQFMLFKTLQRKDSRNHVQGNDIRDSLAGHYKNNDNYNSCTWELQQHENKKLVKYLLKFIAHDDVLPETKFLLAVYFNINDRSRDPRFGWETEMQIVTKNFADLNRLLDTVLTVYSKIKDGKKLDKDVQKIIDNIIRCYEIEKITGEIIKQDDKDKLFLLLQAFENYNFETSVLDSHENKDYDNIIKKVELTCKILLDKKRLVSKYRAFLSMHNNLHIFH